MNRMNQVTPKWQNRECVLEIRVIGINLLPYSDLKSPEFLAYHECKNTQHQ
jgi:hypothetical protein